MEDDTRGSRLRLLAKSGVLESRRWFMITRILLAIANTVLYVALIDLGNQQSLNAYAEVDEAAQKGIIVDLAPFTPWPSGIAHGLNQPVVILVYSAASLLGWIDPYISHSDPEPAKLKFCAAFLSGLFWFFGIGYLQGLSRRKTNGRRTKLAALIVGACLLGCACVWVPQHDFHVPRGLCWVAIGVAFQGGATLNIMFALAWISFGILLFVARGVKRPTAIEALDQECEL